MTDRPASATPPEPTTPGRHPLPIRHHRLRWSVVSIIGILLVVVVIGGWIAIRAISVINTKSLNANGKRLSFFQQLTHIVTASDQKIQGENDDRVNILLLGIGGPGHDGPYLTDTMMVASFKPSTGQLSLLSIPRDLVVNIPGADYRKINSTLSIGRDNNYPGGGEALTVKVVSDLLNIPIQYYALLDFTGFADVINRVGGVDVTVENAFTDYEFPTDNYGYRTIQFKTGTQHMNGSTALDYARSRHGNNGEGSDFARARRQQKVLFALKQKLLSVGTLINPLKISDILGSLGSHSQTNMEVWEMVRLAKLISGIQHEDIINTVIDSSADGLVRNETGIGGAFILVPRDGTYRDIQFLANNVYDLAKAKAENTDILVVNSAPGTVSAEPVISGLQSLGLNVRPVFNLHNTVAEKTIMFDRTSGHAAATIGILTAYRRAQGTTTIDQWESATGDTTLRTQLDHLDTLLYASNTNSDATVNAPVHHPIGVVLILGRDQANVKSVSVIPTWRRPAAASTPIATVKTPTPNVKKSDSVPPVIAPATTVNASAAL